MLEVDKFLDLQRNRKKSAKSVIVALEDETLHSLHQFLKMCHLDWYNLAEEALLQSAIAAAASLENPFALTRSLTVCNLSERDWTTLDESAGSGVV